MRLVCSEVSLPERLLGRRPRAITTPPLQFMLRQRQSMPRLTAIGAGESWCGMAIVGFARASRFATNFSNSDAGGRAARFAPARPMPSGTPSWPRRGYRPPRRPGRVFTCRTPGRLTKPRSVSPGSPHGTQQKYTRHGHDSPDDCIAQRVHGEADHQKRSTKKDHTDRADNPHHYSPPVFSYSKRVC